MKNTSLLLLLFLSLCSFSQHTIPLSLCTPEKVGISSGGLKKIDSVMQRYVDEKKLSGMLTMVARKGKLVSFQKYGYMKEGKPMLGDAIFRIASMTKPVTSVAVMILVDEGRLRLDDPVSKYIPEFKDLEVFSSIGVKGLYTEKQIHPMTIKNLLMHTSGLGSGAEDSYVDSLYRTASIKQGTLKEEIQKLSGIPLKFQPGTRWQYGLSTDVLGYIVELITGKPLDVFFKERIFLPLRMTDTGYSVPEDKLDRVTEVYTTGEKGLIAVNIPEINNVSALVTSPHGNGGLLSTAADYMSFCQMLLNRGEYNGVRILKKETVDLMTSNQLVDELMPDDELFGKIMLGMGFGLGFAILAETGQKNPIGSAGSYWWSGSANTYFYIDPKEELVLIFMTQFIPNHYYPVCSEFRELVYQALLR